MDNTGITMQVLSVDSLGANLVSVAAGPAFATRYNDLIAKKIAAHPKRFTAFAHLPMTAPLVAVDELERTVKEHGFRGAMIRGLTNDQFLGNGGANQRTLIDTFHQQLYITTTCNCHAPFSPRY
jgi:predicted TIM-barrel fold metal-dependent hydrolase